ncbi:hypothetical protein FI615_001672 [Enterococcus faecium]|nr:hypothetical protein [Enterococcus faecium]EHK9936736.1 hypothetical protein [Enterococcus faecium]
MKITDFEFPNDTIKYLEELLEKGSLNLDHKNPHIEALKDAGLIELHLISPCYVTPNNKGRQYLKLYKQQRKENKWKEIRLSLLYPIIASIIVSIITTLITIKLTAPLK